MLTFDFISRIFRAKRWATQRSQCDQFIEKGNEQDLLLLGHLQMPFQIMALLVSFLHMGD